MSDKFINIFNSDKKDNKKYTFIHPTKTGGTALEQYFSKNYRNHISGSGHSNKCNSCDNPIIIIRDPIERIISMYKYWKNGAISGRYQRDEAWIQRVKDIDFENFINLIDRNDPLLFHTFTWNQHFVSYSEWITEKDWKTTIIILYDSNLNNRLNNLFEYLKIPNKNINLNHVNVSKKVDDIILTETIKNKIKKIYKYDFYLWENILNNEELFLKIIR